MKPHTHTFTSRTSSADLVFAFGFSIVMHAVLLLVDPLGHFNVSDRLTEQQNRILMVNLKDRVEPSKPVSVKKVSKRKWEKKNKKNKAGNISLSSSKSKTPATIAKPISPVHEPVHVAKTPNVASAPVPVPVPVPVMPSEVPPPREATPEAEPEIPAPAEKNVLERYQPPVIEPDEQDITITESLKPKPDIVKPVEKPLVQASSDLPEEEIVKEERREEITPPPVLQEVQEPIKPEAPPPVPVAAAPAEPEEKHAAPVKEVPAMAAEQPVAAPVQEAHEPIKQETPLPAPVAAAAVVPEESHAAPVKEAPQNIPPIAKTEEVKVEEPLPKQCEKPMPLDIAPPVGMEEEKEKDNSNKLPVRSYFPKSVNMEPTVIAEKAREKDAAVVRKKTISLSLLKRFAENGPMQIGTPVSKPMIKITTPAVKKVSSRVQEIGGRVKGNGITRVILSINGDSVTVPVENYKFHWEGALIDGKNTVSATAWDRNRYSATDQIIVEAMPARNGFALSLEEPGAGEVASPVITVKGRVGDSTVDTVRLIVNRESVEAAVKENGSFEKTILFQEGENSLQAEAVNSKGASARSSVLKVMVLNREAPDILVHLYWEDPDSELRAEIARKKRDNLDDEQGAVSAVEVSALMSAHEGYREKIFAVYEAKAGAYVLSVIGGKKTKCILSVTVPSKRKTRLFGPILIGEEGTFIGRLLMPEGIYWDEDEWFTGKIENGDSITKYNSPEGTTWKEMK